MSTFLKTTKGKITIACVVMVLVIAAVVAVLAFQTQDKEEYRTIVISEISGTVLVSNAKAQDTPAYSGMALFDGDRVSMADEANLTLELDGDKYMTAEGGTVFSLEATGKAGSDKTVIHLEQGYALNRIESKLNEDQSYVVKTPTSTISVRGTVYSVDVDKDEKGNYVTKCEVFEGTVEVVPVDEKGNPTGEPQFVTAGQSTRVSQVVDEVKDDSEKENSEKENSEKADSGKMNTDKNVPGKTALGKDDKKAEMQKPEPQRPEVEKQKPQKPQKPVTQQEDGEEEHRHGYGEWQFSAENPEHHERRCTCGDIQQEEHSWDKGVDLIQPDNTQSDSILTTVFTCSICHHKKYETREKPPVKEPPIEEPPIEKPPLEELKGNFAVGGAGYKDWYETAMALSQLDGERKVFLLKDVNFANWQRISLPYGNTWNSQEEMIPDFYEMTLNLHGKHLKMGFPQIGKGATLTIEDTEGGFLETVNYSYGGNGVYPSPWENNLEGTLIIKGGRFDFDPTAYVPAGYIVKILREPEDFVTGGWFGGYYQGKKPGLWLVCREGEEEQPL